MNIAKNSIDVFVATNEPILSSLAPHNWSFLPHTSQARIWVIQEFFGWMPNWVWQIEIWSFHALLVPRKTSAVTPARNRNPGDTTADSIPKTKKWNWAASS